MADKYKIALVLFVIAVILAAISVSLVAFSGSFNFSSFKSDSGTPVSNIKLVVEGNPLDSNEEGG